jgi:2-isopropylmalate synthase
VVCGTSGLPTATVQLKGPDHMTHIGLGTGTGEFPTTSLITIHS